VNNYHKIKPDACHLTNEHLAFSWQW